LETGKNFFSQKPCELKLRKWRCKETSQQTGQQHKVTKQDTKVLTSRKQIIVQECKGSIKEDDVLVF